MEQRPLVVIIIVNFNGLYDTVECLNSLRATTYQPYRVIVVDNASKENPLPALSRDFPEVCCVRSEINIGFTGGNNLGIAKAYEMQPKYIFFLNNDTVVIPDTLPILVEFMERNPDVGMAGPLTYYYDDPDVVCFCGGYIERNTGSITFRSKGERLTDIPKDTIYCSFIEGAAIFVRTALVEKAGGFNDNYFLTCEESELCVRIADMGYKLAMVTNCSIRHKVSRSMGAGSELINYFVYRNRLHFIRNNAIQFTFWDLSVIATNYARTLISFIIKKKSLPAAKGLVYGVYDFFLGVTGPGRYKEQLQSSKRVTVI